MIGVSAVLSDIFFLGMALLFLAVSISSYRRRRTAGALAALVFFGLIALVMTARIAGNSYYCLWLRSLEPYEVASMSVGSVEVSTAGDVEKLVSAMNRSKWYVRRGNLDSAKSLLIKLRSGRQISWNVYYDRKHRGAAICFCGGGFGMDFGWVFSPTLVEEAAELGISIPDKPSTR